MDYPFLFYTCSLFLLRPTLQVISQHTKLSSDHTSRTIRKRVSSSFFFSFFYISLLLKASDQLFSSCHAFDQEYAIVRLELMLASFMRYSMNSLANERHRATSIRMSMNPLSRRCAQQNFNFRSYK